MKKEILGKILVTTLITIFGMLNVNANNVVNNIITLSSSNISNYESNGYILSDKFTTYDSCNTEKTKFDIEYPSYKRSDCFNTDSGYKYFICQSTSSCSITANANTVTITNSGTNSQTSTSLTSTNSLNSGAIVKNKDKLDNFISKVGSLKTTMTPEKFKTTLDSLVSRLTKLENKYSSNTDIKNMIVYLNNGLKELYNSNDIDNFLCELTDTCANEINIGQTGSIQPKVVYTDSSLVTQKTSYKQGERLYGYVEGGDINNIYACTAPATNDTCANGQNFRKLGVPYNGSTPDEWQINQTTKRIELRNGFSTDGFPLGTYNSYVKNGSNGTVYKLTLNLVAGNTPTVVYTDSSLVTQKTSYKQGERLYGYVEGGDINNIYACTASTTNDTCANGQNFRKLGVPYNGNTPDEWQINQTTKRIELRNGFSTDGFPLGTYNSYVKNGTNGTVYKLTLNLVAGNTPTIVYTDSSLVTEKTIYVKGEMVYGYVQGGDINNIYACTAPATNDTCANGQNFRKLGVPYNGSTPDEWQINQTTKRIELRNGFSTDGFPLGTYNSYVKNGTNGTASKVTLNLLAGNNTTTYSWLPSQFVIGGCAAKPVCNASNVGQVIQPSCGATEPWTCKAVTTATTTTPITNINQFSVSAVIEGSIIKVNYNIPASTGYKTCVMAVGDKDVISISGTSVLVTSGSRVSLDSSTTGFNGSKYFQSNPSYLNLYCGKLENSDLTKLERIITPTLLSELLNNPISTINVSPIPGNTNTTTGTQPRLVYTDSSLVTEKTSYVKGEMVYGYVQGGDINNTYACTSSSTNDICANGQNFRKLTIPVVSGQADDWQYNASTKRIELRNGFSTSDLPLGTYNSYVKTGLNGAVSKVTLNLVAGNNTSSCNWKKIPIAVFGGTGPNDYTINTNTTPCTQSNNGATSYYKPTNEKSAICECSGNSVTVLPTTPITTQPRLVYTDSSLVTEKTSYVKGEMVYGYVQGGDINNTYACTSSSINDICANGQNFRKLTIPVVSGQADDWQYNASTKRIELRNGFSTSDLPLGTYNSYVKTGLNGAVSKVTLNLVAGTSTTLKTCAGGSHVQSSPNNLQSCSFTWPSRTSGQYYVGQGTNGGSISGTCGSDGEWKNVIISCPNPVSQVKTCAGGSHVQNSPNNLQSCSFTWPSRTSGQSYSGQGTNGGNISGTCGSDGLWKDVIISCPN